MSEGFVAKGMDTILIWRNWKNIDIIIYIFYLYVIFCGPGFVSIPSNQSRVHSFPHKPFWHTCMAYIPVVPHKAVAEVSKMESLWVGGMQERQSESVVVVVVVVM